MEREERLSVSRVVATIVKCQYKFQTRARKCLLDKGWHIHSSRRFVLHGCYVAYSSIFGRSTNVHFQIKYLNAYIDLRRLEERFEDFKDWCHILFAQLKLEKLRFEFQADEQYLPSKMLADPDMSASIAEVRKIPVALDFTLTVSIWVRIDSFTSEDERDDYQAALENCQKRFMELMLPDTLREQPVSNEMERYLLLRSETPVPRRATSPAPSSYRWWME